ncbi:diacylglycerol ethanolaminesphotransferase [Schizosaccharomyces japonicus yFS275]|uniref:Diacylglycerol ethanolaminesphotransferase n=1 Tax=Schizosaccharomyces japonicus (strain yFS275 / FY16936) TaxID=402676 RepID=B6K6I6_SCHJY|nr:diacylglycerol ethanolaminesphotransferase [Schizosaccharomyces japonicus yFS275]EEB09140.1 diacylglycerol ethanolaminesphotransferase [Schizosaccharomyces japonicus yFS275]
MQLTRTQLKNLRNYRYSGIDQSLMSRYVLKPYWWNQLLKVIPLNMAPNLITLTGLGFVLINVATLVLYKYVWGVEIPRWVYYTWAVGLFLYQSFDAIDGSQARRTGTSSPLGQLFDHGVDAINTSLEALLFLHCMKSSLNLCVVAQFGCLFYFYASTWEEFHTGTLYLSYVSGPVEGILIVVAIFTVTGAKGVEFWTRQHAMPDFFGNLVLIYKPTFSYGDCLVAFLGTGLVLNVVASIANALATVKGCCCRAFKILLGLLPYLVQWMAVGLLFIKYRSFFDQHFLIIYILNAFIFAYTVGLVILAHVTEARFPYWNVLMLPFVVLAADSLTFNIFTPYMTEYLFAYLGFSIGVYGNFVAHVIAMITEEFNIRCLTMGPKYPEVKKDE